MLLATYIARLSLGKKETFIFIEFNYLWHDELVWDGRKDTEKVWVGGRVLLLPDLETWTKYILSVLLFICINHRHKLSSFLKRDVMKIKIRQCIEKYFVYHRIVSSKGYYFLLLVILILTLFN